MDIQNRPTLIEKPIPFYKINSDKLSTITKIAKIAGLIFLAALVGTAIGCTTALSCGLNIVVLASAGALVGAVLAAALAALCLLFRQPVPLKKEIEYRKPIEVKIREAADSLKKKNPCMSKEDLDNILNLVEAGKPKALEQYKLFEFRLVKELGEEKAKEALALEGLFPPSLQDRPNALSDKEIDALIAKASNHFSNLKIIEEMHEKAKEQSIDASSIEEVLSLKEVKEYIEEKKPITQDISTVILKTAKELEEKRGEGEANEKFEFLIEKIRIEAQRDLYLEENYINSKYAVEETLSHLSEEIKEEKRTALQKIINHAYINRALKQKGKLATPTSDEKYLLKTLGYPIDRNSPYENKAIVYNLLVEVVLKQMAADGFKGPIKEVKLALKEQALQTRLKMVGIENEQVSKFKKAQLFFRLAANNLRKEYRPLQPPFPEGFPLKSSKSLGRQMICSLFSSLKSKAIRELLTECLEEDAIQAAFRDEAIDENQFKQMIQKRYSKKKAAPSFAQKLEGCKENEQLNKQIGFYTNWGYFLKKELIQGFDDPDDALQLGVCWGICARLLYEVQKNRGISVEEFVKKLKILPIDRYNQVLGRQAVLLNKENKMSSPRMFLKKYGFKGYKPLYEHIYDSEDNELEKLLRSNMLGEKIENANGWLQISLSLDGTAGHAILLRLDPKENKVWLFDPNFGFFAFENEEGFEEARELCFRCLKDLIATEYNTNYNLKLYCMAAA